MKVHVAGAAVVGLAALVPLLPPLIGSRTRTLDPPAPNVVLISVDTLRADAVGAYGHPGDVSPTVDALAAESVRFSEAIAASSWTLPSHASFLTGYLPTTIHVLNSENRVPDPVVTLAERMRERGYRTGAITGGALVSPIFGFGQGFDSYWGAMNRYAKQAEEVVEIVDRSIGFLDANAGRPFFLFVHTYQVHDPFFYHEGISAPGAERCTDPAQRIPECRDAYEGEIRFMDLHLKRFLDAMKERGLYDDALIVFVSDHGEMFDEDRRPITGHANFLYDELIHVPLLIRLPGGREAGRVVDGQVPLLDLVPTILDVVGAPPSDGDGRSLVPLIEGRGRPAAAIVSMHHYRSSQKVYEKYNRTRTSVRTEGAKLIENPPDVGNELYDLTADPAERANLWPDADARAMLGVDPMLDVLAQTHSAAAESRYATGQTRAPEISDDLRERLIALGYWDQ